MFGKVDVMKGKLRLILVSVMAVAVIGLLAIPSAFATGSTVSPAHHRHHHHHYPPRGPTCSVDPTKVHPGQAVDLSGRHWAPVTNVRISFHQGNLSKHMATATTDNNGNFNAGGVIPNNAKNGGATVRFVGTKRHRRAVCTVAITVKKGHHELASVNTAMAITPIKSMPVVLLVGGLSLMLALHRRRHRNLI